MNKKSLLIIAACFVGLVGVTGALALFKVSAPTDGRLKIVAAENFWGSIATQISGNRAVVSSVITDPSADPHLYESGAKDASAITNANIVIVNGLGYDDAIIKLLAASPRAGRTVINAAHVADARTDSNPHLWYDFAAVRAVATEIQKQLAAKDLDGASVYQANLAAFVDSLQSLNDRLQHIRQTFPAAPVAYTERVPGYMLRAAGLTVLTPANFASAIEDGNEPSPADQSAMVALMTEHKIRVLIYNAQASSPVTQHMREVAAARHIPVVAMTETPPADTTYQNWQSQQLDALIAALEVR